MSELERDLKAALNRKPAPAGLAERVLEQLEGSGPAGKSPVWQRPRLWVTLAIAASLLISLGGLEYQRYRGRQAKQELMAALSVTSEKLSATENRVMEISNKRIILHE